MTALKSPGISRTKFVAPKPNGFVADRNSLFCQQILDIAMAKIESMIKPYGILNDFRRETMAFIPVGWVFHPAILNQLDLTCQYRGRAGACKDSNTD